MAQDDIPAGFADTDDEAQRRFERFVSRDPLPDVAQALFNSADIEEYVKLTGMVFPFNLSDGKLKSASYEADFLGDLHVVDPTEGYRKIVIQHGKRYPLRKNSISFLFLATVFRLPDYIAARFNLRITHVHAGLLLGTGPLIDPGFAGRLLIPLHNLTSEDYFITGGDGLIWVEFTKLSNNARWDPKSTRTGLYRSFPSDKRHLGAERYFKKAGDGRDVTTAPGEVRPASSSIPGEIKTATRTAGTAEEVAIAAQKDVSRLKRIGLIGGLVTAVGLILSLSSILIGVYGLVQDANKNVVDAGKSISDYRDAQNELDKRISALAAEVKSLQDERSRRAPLKSGSR